MNLRIGVSNFTPLGGTPASLPPELRTDPKPNTIQCIKAPCGPQPANNGKPKTESNWPLIIICASVLLAMYFIIKN